MYYVKDGVYSSFNSILYNHAAEETQAKEMHYLPSILGSPCNDLDHIMEKCDLPKLHMGDWMLCKNVGASSGFNGFQRPTINYRV